MKLPFIVLLLLLPLASFAQEPTPDAPTLTLSEANALLAGLGIQVKAVNKAPIQGMWELIVEKGGQRSVAYIDFAKKHLVPGPVFDIATRSIVGTPPNLPPQVQPAKLDPARIPLTDSLVMGNPNGKKRLIVFTDPDCPYCAKLHWELVRLIYMEPDLAVYIKMFPLTIHPGAFDKARVILGQKSLKLLDQAFTGEKLPVPGPGDPAAPVEASIRLGESLGVDSTPTLILPDGRALLGVRSAPDIKKLLAIDAQ